MPRIIQSLQHQINTTSVVETTIDTHKGESQQVRVKKLFQTSLETAGLHDVKIETMEENSILINLDSLNTFDNTNWRYFKGREECISDLVDTSESQDSFKLRFSSFFDESSISGLIAVIPLFSKAVRPRKPQEQWGKVIGVTSSEKERLSVQAFRVEDVDQEGNSRYSVVIIKRGHDRGVKKCSHSTIGIEFRGTIANTAIACGDYV